MKNTILVFWLFFVAAISKADEGMWLFNEPPQNLLRQRYDFDASHAWLEHLQKSSVRFNSGGSGSFVSADGLLISNHHVGADALQKLSTAQTNYVRDGFHARTLAEEVKCLDLELNVLESIEDVTPRVNFAIPTNADAATAFAARRKVIAQIEKESQEFTGLRSDVVTLWQGGAYHLYRFKRYTDVRLVFAPEQQIAFYGGDPDNFEFPRYDLDICFFRAYENGKPVKVTSYLRFSTNGPSDGDLVFVSGHPGHTSRMLTVSELRDVRDSSIPFVLNQLRRQEVLLSVWGERSEENNRRAKKLLFGLDNNRKRYNGEIAGLLDPELMAAKVKAENDFKSRLSPTNESAGALAAFDKISTATTVLANQMRRSALLEGGQAFNCDSFRIAKTLLRAADEFQKTNGDRLHEYSDSGKVSLELALFSQKPIYPDLEILTLADSLTFAASELRVEYPLMARILGGKSPHERAVELINGTKVREVDFRRQLYEGGVNAVLAANDPMIELARLVDPDARELRKVSDEQSELKQQAHAAIAHVRKSMLGTEDYPDATFTLRLAFGTVKGYSEDGATVPPFTTLGGLFDRAKLMKDHPPFDLPVTWDNARKPLDAQTRYDFVSTADIIGGNSGSPVVNRKGEFVGIIFDGNLQSLSWDFAYSDRQGRATSVDSTAILEALKKVYKARELVDELTNGEMTHPVAVLPKHQEISRLSRK